MINVNKLKTIIVKIKLIARHWLCLSSLKSQVGLLQTAHSWANAGVLLGARVRRRVAFETINYRDEVSERRKVIVN